ncbi:MAG: relaxase/mobilization nuclease domain-containing protein [Eubacterium sp.]|nr:relaxase/mobilization nuclease domain-containing protein [Eubacterium sp.]
MKYIAVHKSPKNFLRYIMNSDKTEEMKLVTGLNCTSDLDFAYNQFSRVFEKFAKERFCKKSISDGKEKIRLHHYIQSFKPDEISPEEAHKVGVEWAEKVFGKNHQVLVTTHVDRQHIHNHFAVAAYDLFGKKWYGNKTSLKLCRDVSDKICKSHGLSIIEKPTYRANQKYSDWLARQNGVSWKTRLCDEIDNLVLREDVRTVEDFSEQLRKKYYAVTLKKYLSIKVSKNRKAIRSYRLGDGYAIEELQYRIENKNRELSLQAVAKFQGIQREYAMCLRELQIMVYRKKDNSHKTTYRELRQNAELLTFICDNKIQSITDFENVVNAAAEKSDSLKKSRDKLLREIEEKEGILKDGARYIELNKIKMPTAVQLEELAGLKHLSKFGLRSVNDIEVHRQELEKLKSEISEIDKSIEIAEKEKSAAANNYKTYLRQMQSDYDFILERQRREREEVEQAEREFQVTKISENRQKNYFER